MSVFAKFAGGGMGSNASHTGSIRRTYGDAFTARNTPPRFADFLSLSHEPHEADNILITKDKTWRLSILEAENLLNMSELFAIQENG